MLRRIGKVRALRRQTKAWYVSRAGGILKLLTSAYTKSNTCRTAPTGSPWETFG